MEIFYPGPVILTWVYLDDVSFRKSPYRDCNNKGNAYDIADEQD
jgi:hypothetical protein